MGQVRSWLLACIFLLLLGCGGGSSGPVTATGIFSDAPVEGIHYRFGNYSGLTGPGGVFTYLPGSTGTFRIGDIVVGHAPGKAFLTPVDLVAARHPEYSPAQNRAEALKLVQFMTSLGGGAAQSQLTISPQVTQAATGNGLGSVDLSTADLTTLVGSLGSYTLTSASDADSHLTASMGNADLARHAGEYVVTGTGQVAFAYLDINSQGQLIAVIVDTSGVLHETDGTVTPDGAITFGTSSLANGNPAAGTIRNNGFSAFGGSGSGTSNGAGVVTGTLSFEGRTGTVSYRLNLTRGTNATNKFFGLYIHSYGYFCVDGDGNMTGYSTGIGRTESSGTPISGKVDATTGKFALSGNGVTFTGTITGTTFAGKWTMQDVNATISGQRVLWLL